MIQNREMALMLGVNAPRHVPGGVRRRRRDGRTRRRAHRARCSASSPTWAPSGWSASFFVVTVGGLGAIVGGTLVGSAMIGGATSLFALVTQQVFAQTVVFALAVVALRFRPVGILGRR